MPIVDCVYERGQFFLPLSLNGAGPAPLHPSTRAPA